MKVQEQKIDILRLASEALLQQALAGLLARLPDVSGVQILQGNQEYGKDIIFQIKGGFGEQIPCACVVKNHKITGVVDSSKGARTILLQAHQAFDTPHYDGVGNPQHIQRVYVVTPASVPPATINSVRGALRERAGQVIFIGGPELFDLFKKYWPDFLAEEAHALETHLRDFQASLRKNTSIANVANLYNLGISEKQPEKIYVPQHFHRQILRLKCASTSSFFPTENELLRKWQRSEVDEKMKLLSVLRQSILDASEWAYTIPGKDEVEAARTAILEFRDKLDSSFKESLRREYTPTRPTIPTVGKDAQVFLHDAKELAKEAIALRSRIDKVLSPLRDATSAIDALLEMKNKSSEIVADPNFLAVSKLLDFWHIAPSLFFIPDPAKVLRFSKTIITNSDISILITGTAGYGKTSFCKWHALDDAGKYRDGQSDIVPGYIPLHRVSPAHLGSFEGLVGPYLGTSAVAGGIDIPRGAKVRLYLDGLDEISEQETVRKIAEMARIAVQEKKVKQVVMTSRDYVYSSWLTWLPRVSLSGFDGAQVRELVDQWFRAESGEATKFIAELSRSESLAALMHTPLLATLIILVFRQTGRLPENEVKLYDIFTDLLSEGWNLAKRILKPSKYGSHLKNGVLRQLAVAIHERKQRQFKEENVLKAARDCVRFDEEEINSLVSELFQDGLIIKTIGACEFSHLSFQEYFTARHYIGDPSQRGIRKALRAFLRGDRWWRQVLRFYIGLSGSPREVDDWITKEEYKLEDYSAEGIGFYTEELRRIITDLYPHS